MLDAEPTPTPSTAGEVAVTKVKARMAAEGETWQDALIALVNNGDLCS